VTNQTVHFANDLERLINRYRSEYDITYAQLVGVLHIQSHLLCREAEERSKPEEDHGVDDYDDDE